MPTSHVNGEEWHNLVPHPVDSSSLRPMARPRPAAERPCLPLEPIEIRAPPPSVPAPISKKIEKKLETVPGYGVHPIHNEALEPGSQQESVKLLY